MVHGVLTEAELVFLRGTLDQVYATYDPKLDGLERFVGCNFSSNLVNKNPFFETMFLRSPVYDIARLVLGEDCILSSLNSLEPLKNQGNQSLHRDGPPQPADGPEVYLRMLQAIDCLQAGALLDPLNILSSPRACYENGAILRTCFRLLGQRIVSCHSKDILLKNVYLPLETAETYTGAGVLDYDVYLAELAKLPHEPPLMIEHLEAYQLPLAIRFLHNKAKALGIPLRAAHHLGQ